MGFFDHQDKGSAAKAKVEINSAKPANSRI